MPPRSRPLPAHMQQFSDVPSDMEDYDEDEELEEEEDDEDEEEEEVTEDDALPDDQDMAEDIDGDLDEYDDDLDYQSRNAIPDNFREISGLASWTVSSSKPGCSVPQLRSPSTTLFWQSDGPQPHYLNIHFFKLVRIVGLRLYLDFEADESYTPTRIIFLAGSGQNDLVEWGEMRLEQPRGWIWADFDGVGEASSDEESHDEDSDQDGGDNTIPSPNPRFSHLQGNLPRQPLVDPMNIDTPVLPQNFTPALLPPVRTPQQQLQTPGFGQVPARPQATSLPFTPPLPPPPQVHPRLSPSSPPFPTPSVHQQVPNLPPGTSPGPRQKKGKYPVLRAHLVQIKILENHQNGKDTHLRGVQIFALDDEKDKEGQMGLGLRVGVAMKPGGFRQSLLNEKPRPVPRADGRLRRTRLDDEEFALGNGWGDPVLR